LQTAQAVHAALQFSTEFPAVTAAWALESNYIVCLAARDRSHLLEQFDRCSCAEFRALVLEPDLDNEATAFAVLGVTAGRLLSSLPLSGKEFAHS
jgi:hypothetical protein